MADEASISIATMQPPGLCAVCRKASGCSGYSLNGYATTAQIGDGILSFESLRLSTRLQLLLCKPCLVVIVKGKLLTLQG